MDVKQIRDRYFLYLVLNTFTQSLLFAFGALLIYSKTHSILWVLLYNMAANVTSTLVKSAGFDITTRSMRRGGFAPLMTLGLFMATSSYMALFFLKNTASGFFFFLLATSVIGSIGRAIYNTGNTTLQLEVIGISKLPGFSAAQIDILQIVSGLLAVIVGVILNYFGLFNYLFLVGAGMLILSLLPLYGLPSPKMHETNFRSNFKTKSFTN